MGLGGGGRKITNERLIAELRGRKQGEQGPTGPQYQCKNRSKGWGGGGGGERKITNERLIAELRAENKENRVQLARSINVRTGLRGGVANPTPWGRKITNKRLKAAKRDEMVQLVRIINVTKHLILPQTEKSIGYPPIGSLV